MYSVHCVFTMCPVYILGTLCVHCGSPVYTRYFVCSLWVTCMYSVHCGSPVYTRYIVCSLWVICIYSVLCVCLMTRFYIRFSVFILCPMHMSGTLCAFSVPHVYVRYVVSFFCASCVCPVRCIRAQHSAVLLREWYMYPVCLFIGLFLRSVPLVFATDMCCPWQVSSKLVF